MPDGDVVHNKLSAGYWGPYKGLTSLNFDPQMTAHEVVLPLKKRLERRSDMVVTMISDGCTFLKQLPNEPLFKQGVDYGQVSRQLDAFLQNYPADHRTKELVKSALRQQVDNYRYGNMSVSIEGAVQDCFMRTYDEQFAQRAPFTTKHPNGIDFSTVEHRLQEMRGYVESEVESFAKNAVEGRKMRRRPLRQPKASLDDSPY